MNKGAHKETYSSKRISTLRQSFSKGGRTSKVKGTKWVRLVSELGLLGKAGRTRRAAVDGMEKVLDRTKGLRLHDESSSDTNYRF
jgi:hypothetical protein